MNIQGRKIKFVQEFLEIQSEDVIAQFEELLKKEKRAELEKSSLPMSIVELNERIDKSEHDFRNGRYKASSELIDKYK